ncbi:Acid sphingomyelinase-like phosphodiesterase 3a [Eufriesea mexicana]|nr:Acid sphingomyelinase-like phosphodiesterase 3a [Eufriesea mexicana]
MNANATGRMQIEAETQKARRPRSLCFQGISGTSPTSTMTQDTPPRRTQRPLSIFLFQACWNTWNGVSSGRKTPGEFGDYGCDSPWALVESAAMAMTTHHGEGIKFVLWTGDALTRFTNMSAELRLQCLRNLTELLSRTFKEQFVFPALGHDDIGVSFSQHAELWKQWLPQEALDTFKSAGYYTIEQRSEKYRIIFLNTNLWLKTDDNRTLHRSGRSMIDNTQDPFNQWSWFQTTLDTARSKKETNKFHRENRSTTMKYDSQNAVTHHCSRRSARNGHNDKTGPFKARSEDKCLPKGGETPSTTRSRVEENPSFELAPPKGHPRKDPFQKVTAATSRSVYARESQGCARPPHVAWPRPPTAHLAARY